MVIAAWFALALTSPAPVAAQEPVPAPPTHDGHARFDPDARVLGDGRVRMQVGCPGPTRICSGKATITSKGRVRTRASGPRRRVVLATTRFTDIQPGEWSTFVVRPSRAARYHLARHRRVLGEGKVRNDLADGATITTYHPVTIANPHAN
jgi:hypothetical protein